MRKLATATLVLIIFSVYLVSCGSDNKEKVVHESKVHPKNGLIYEKKIRKPFNGYVYKTYPNGKIKVKYHFQNGDYNGKYTRYYENGKISGTGCFRNSLNNGKFVQYTPEGKISYTQHYVDDLLDGEYIQYYDNGKIQWKSNFRNDRFYGKRTNYFKNGNIEEVGFLDCGFWFGKRMTYYPNGKLKENATYDSNKLHGPYESYTKDGLILEKGNYYFGKKSGKYYCYQNGSIDSECSYKNGKLHGISKYYYENGQIREKCNYKTNTKNGERILYSHEGKAICKLLYHNDKIYQRIRYLANGNEDSGKINFNILYCKTEKQYNEIEVPYYNGAFTARDYDRQTIYPFLRKHLGNKEEYRNHPIYDGLCKNIAGVMAPVYKEKYLYLAKESTAKHKDDVISTLFLYYNSPNYFKPNDWLERIDKCLNKVGNESFYRYLLVWIRAKVKRQPAPLKKLREIAFDFAANNKLPKRESQYIYRLIYYCSSAKDKTDLSPLINKIDKNNTWLINTLHGFNTIRKAWFATNQAALSEAGKKQNVSRLEKAQKQLFKAWDMHKDLPETAQLMINISMLNGSIDDSITWFNRCTSAQIDYNDAYRLMESALSSKWNGSAKLLEQMAESCYQSGISLNKITTNVPLKMLTFLRLEALENQAESWQTPYKKNGRLEKIKKCVEYWLGYKNQDKDKYKTALAIFSHYAGDDNSAIKIINDIGTSKFTETEKELKQLAPQFFMTQISVAKTLSKALKP